MSAKHAKSLLTSRRFAPLFGAQVLSGFTDATFRNAIIALIAFAGLSFGGMEKEVLIPLAGSIFTFPFILLSAFGGQLADKFDKATILKRVKFAEILIMLVAAAGLHFNSAPLLLLTLFFMGAQSALFTPSRTAAMPQWLKDDELITGNALISGVLNLLLLIGTAFGLMMTTKAGGTVWVSGALILVATMGWLCIRQVPPGPPPAPDLKLRKNLIASTFNTLGEAERHPEVFRPMLGTAWFWGMSALMMVLIPSYIPQVLHYDVNVMFFVMLLFTVGMFAGAMITALFTKGGDAHGFSVIGAFGLVVFGLDLYFTGGDNGRTTLGGVSEFLGDKGNGRLMFDLFATSVCGGIFVVPLQAMSQRRAAPKLRARLLSAGAILNAIATTGMQLALFGMNKAGMPMRTSFLIVAVISLIVALYSLKRWLAKRATAP
jgi:MFS family permease